MASHETPKALVRRFIDETFVAGRIAAVDELRQLGAGQGGQRRAEPAPTRG